MAKSKKADELENYQNLRLRESLSLSYRYPMACRELGVILRLAYSKSPKTLQSLLLEDTLFAFRLLPQMQTQSAVSAANLLIQSAEAALPKQKRGLASSEYKKSKVAYKRRAKMQQPDTDLAQLPQDVLVHLFTFLDIQSLVSASMVCGSWNAAANDNYVWKFHYNYHFGECESVLKREGLQGDSEDEQNAASDSVCEWKDAFRRAYLGLPSWRYKFYRGYCGHCDSIVWLNNLRCPNKHSSQIGQLCGNYLLKPLSPTQIVRYIFLGDTTWWGTCSSDSDSESDEELGLKFWTYLRH